MQSATFTLADLPEDAFWRAVSSYLTPGYDAREIAIVYFPDTSEMHWLAGAGPFPGGDTVGGIQTHGEKVRYWVDPNQVSDAWNLAAALSQLGVILELFPCASLEWEPRDAEGEMGALFTAAMQGLRAGKAGVKGKGANVPGDKASEIAARRNTILERWEHRPPGTTKEKFKRDTASDLAVSESTVRDDLRYWADEGKIK